MTPKNLVAHGLARNIEADPLAFLDKVRVTD